MFDNSFITQMLNVDSSLIQEVKTISSDSSRISVKIRLIDKKPLCPCCGSSVKIHGYYSRKLIHSTFNYRDCAIHYSQRRYKCSQCDFTFNEFNPFSTIGEGLTHETKINILKDLKYSAHTYTYVANKYGISKTKVLRLFEKHVNIPRKKLPLILSIDEHYFPKSDYDSLYCCLLMDFLSGTIVDVLPDRKKHI